KQLEAQDMPSNARIASWAMHVLHLLFPERGALHFDSAEEVRQAFDEARDELLELLQKTEACSHCNNERIADEFFVGLPAIYEVMLIDAEAIMQVDTAAQRLRVEIRTYTCFNVICLYCRSH